MDTIHIKKYNGDIYCCEKSKLLRVETGVHKTVDGKYIICHDSKVKRLCLDDMIVEKATFEALRSIKLYDIDM